MDNRHVDVTSEGKGHLRLALELVWSHSKATHFQATKLSRSSRVYGKQFKDAEPPVVDWKYVSEITPLVSRVEGSWKEDPEGIPTLILYWVDPKEKDVVPLPFSLTKDAAPEFVHGWLQDQAYGKGPDIDGDTGKGWRVFNEAWGHVIGRYQAFVAIQPAWAMYGK